MMKEVVMGWYGYDVARFVQDYHALGQAWLCYTHDDTYMGDLQDSKLGGSHDQSVFQWHPETICPMGSRLPVLHQ